MTVETSTSTQSSSQSSIQSTTSGEGGDQTQQSTNQSAKCETRVQTTVDGQTETQVDHGEGEDCSARSEIGIEGGGQASASGTSTTMTAGAARVYARSAVRRTRSDAAKPKVACAGKSPRRFRCKATWSARGGTHQAKLTVWYDADGDSVAWRYRGKVT